MIDTVSLKHVVSPPLSEDHLRDIGAVEPYGKRRHRAFVINPVGSYGPAITFANTPNGVQHCFATVSVPKFIHGHNAELPKDQLTAFGSIFGVCDYVEQRTGIPFDPLTATVTEAHFAKDFFVGAERVIPILRTLSTRILPGYKRTRYDDTGIQFRRKQSSLVCYSKHHEVMTKNPDNLDALQAANGILRIENRRTSRAIQTMGADRSASHIVTEAFCDAFIDQAIDRLALDDAIEHYESEPALDSLLKRCKPSAAWRLFGFLKTLEQYGQGFWRIQSLGIPKRTYDNNLRELRKAGVGLD